VRRSNSSRAVLECRGRWSRWGWLWRILWQGLNGPGQYEAFQLCRLLALPSESKSILGGSSGRPGHSAVTGIIAGNVFGRIEDVGHEAGRFNTNGPAELHTLLKASQNGRREDVLGTLLPGSDGPTGLAFLTEDQPNEHVHTAEGEEEEGRDEGEAVNTVGKNCSSNQALNDAKSADTEVVSKDREEPLEENRGPTDFREEEDDDLSNDQKTVENGPEDAGRLVWNGGVRDIIFTDCRGVVRRNRVGSILVGVESLDILDEGHDAARKDENKGDDAQSSDDIQPNEHVSSGWKHDGR